MNDIDRVVKGVSTKLGQKSEWPDWPGGWKQQADAALLDAVFSAQARYETTVLPLVKRWQNAPERPKGGRLSGLLTVDQRTLERIVQNRQRVPGPSPDRPTKVRAVRDVAKRLTRDGVDTPGEVRKAAKSDPHALKKLFTATSGVGPATFRYFLMLLGVQGVKADTMVSRILHSALRRDVSQSEAETLVEKAAKKLHADPIALDYAIWRYQSGRA